MIKYTNNLLFYYYGIVHVVLIISENSMYRKAKKANAFVDIEATTPKELIEPSVNDINTIIL